MGWVLVEATWARTTSGPGPLVTGTHEIRVLYVPDGGFGAAEIVSVTLERLSTPDQETRKQMLAGEWTAAMSTQ